MNAPSFLVWIPIAILVLLILLRLTKKRGAAETDKQSNQTKLLYFFIIVSVVVIVVQYFSGNINFSAVSSNNVLTTAISPENFAEMVETNNQNSVAGIFYDKKFKASRSAKQTIYTLKNPKWHDGDDKKDEVLEDAFYNTEEPGKIFYDLYKREKYLNFLNRLKVLHPDTLNPAEYKSGPSLIKDYPAYKYKNCVFVDYDFVDGNEGFTIEVFNSDLLNATIEEAVADTPKKVKTADCFEKKDSYRFKEGDYGNDYIRLYNRDGNTFEFAGVVGPNQAISGKVEKSDMKLLITSGNAVGEFVLLDNCKTLIVNIRTKGDFGERYSVEMKQTK